MVKSASRGKPARSSGIQCVAYLRMSSDKQDKSLPAQRQEIQRWCDKHDYSVIQWYEEPGISGDDTRRRIVFQRMMSEVIDSDATAIVVWDQDRFGRFDSVESGFWIHPLRAAGISLATVTEGVAQPGRNALCRPGPPATTMVISLARRTRGTISLSSSRLTQRGQKLRLTSRPYKPPSFTSPTGLRAFS